MSRRVPEFEFAADAWDWLHDEGFVATVDVVVKDSEGQHRHQFDFVHADGSKARLFVSMDEEERKGPEEVVDLRVYPS